jgi:hypothetical protein
VSKPLRRLADVPPNTEVKPPAGPMVLHAKVCGRVDRLRLGFFRFGIEVRNKSDMDSHLANLEEGDVVILADQEKYPR